jgi:hypothetical protein
MVNGGCNTSISNHHTMVKEPITVKIATFFLPKSGTICGGKNDICQPPQYP